MITAFNAIRGNALMALCAAAAQEVEALLQDSCALLANVPIMRKLGSGERAAHLEACRAMVDTACPLVLQLFKQVRRACIAYCTLRCEDKHSSHAHTAFESFGPPVRAVCRGQRL